MEIYMVKRVDKIRFTQDNKEIYEEKTYTERDI